MSYQEISAQSRERDIWVRGPPVPCVSEGHKMSKKAWTGESWEGATAFLWRVSVAPNLNSPDCQGLALV